MPETQNTMVIYHGNCWDGFCAAWLFSKVFPDAEFVPAQYGQDPPDVARKEVYILDFSYKRDVLFKMWVPNKERSQVKKLVVLDHHKTAEADLKDFDVECVANGLDSPTIWFDMNKSGGRIAWEYLCSFHQIVDRFCGQFGRDYCSLMQLCRDVPCWPVTYTEDRDLWRWRLPNSREITTGLRSWPLDFKVWDQLFLDGSNALRDDGEAIMRSESVVIGNHVRHAREIEMSGHKILAVNATVLFSDIAGTLAKGRPFGAAYFDRGDGKRQWSLRSTDEGVDVSEIAKAHGGGGHRNAAGFEEIVSS